MVETDADGRTYAPVTPKENLAAGVWELVLHAGDYLEAAGVPGEGPRLLDRTRGIGCPPSATSRACARS
jgi:5-hydroxyisourate hydrolase